jgi:hypothetical protein
VLTCLEAAKAISARHRQELRLAGADAENDL